MNAKSLKILSCDNIFKSPVVKRMATSNTPSASSAAAKQPKRIVVFGGRINFQCAHLI